MDPASWSAYSQHLSRLGASMNASSGSLPQSAQLNDLALSSTLPRQDHLPGYGNAAGPHPFLLAASHGLNPAQASNRGDPSFNAFVTNYDASLLSASFQQSNKGHISSFPQGVGLFKAVGRDNDYPDLRTGFAHCGMASYGRNPDGNAGLSGTSGLGSNALFPNSMPSGSWRPTGIMPSSCGPFGILPHETVLQRSHLARRNSEKSQGSKSSRSSLSGTTFMEQDLSRGYRGILSSPARPPSSFMDPNNPNSSLLSPQNDPYFSSVTDSYYSSCSKPDFGPYSSYCSNMQNAVQRSAISPYCYPQSYGSLEGPLEKQEHASSSLNASVSANTGFSNFVPNSNLNRSHQPNGLVPRQTVITSNTNSSYTSQHPSAHQSHSYTSSRDAYNCVSSLPNSSIPSSSNGSSGSSGRSTQGQSNSSHHVNVGQPHYPPMSTPIPAATPAHPTPPSTMGQAHVPVVLPMSHDSGYSSINSQSVVYNSASNDECYSTPGTCDSESTSPAKQELSQHSSPLGYPVDNSSNLNISNSPYVESNRLPSQSCREVNPLNADENTVKSNSKTTENNLSAPNSSMIPSECQMIPKNLNTSALNSNNGHVIPPNLHPSNIYENTVLNMSHPNVHNPELLNECNSGIPSRSDCPTTGKSAVFPSFPSESPPPVDYTQKTKSKVRRGRKRKSDPHEDSYSPNFGYPHIPNLSQSLPPQPPLIMIDAEKGKPLNSADYDDMTDQSKYPMNDASSLPVDLSHVPLSLSTKKPDSPVPQVDIDEKSTKMPDITYEHNILPANWRCSNNGESTSDKEPERTTHSSPPPQSPDIDKTSQELCPASSIEDLSNESKSKLCNNIEDDLGFLAELSAASDVDDTTSKESFPEKKGKKQEGFLQSFLTFLESSNEPTAPSEAQSQETKKVLQSEKCETPELPILTITSKDVESENNWLVNNENKTKPTKKDSEKMSESKTDELEVISEEKDNFEEAPSLDTGLFNCTSLQKEMVVPNPEAPSFSSDEDENSAQGIFDSVAMAIQRLCDDNEDDNKAKSPGSDLPKVEDISKTDAKVSSDTQDTSIDILLKETEEPLDPSKTEDEVAETVPPLIVKHRRGKRKRGRHLLVIKVNRVKKQSTVSPVSTESPQNVKIANKPKRKSSRTNKFQAVETPTENSGRRPLMRKCKQKRFQRNCETKRKRKTRNSGKLKYTVDDQDEKEVIVLDDDDDDEDNEKKSEEKPVEMVKSTVTISIAATTVAQDLLPKKIKKISKKRRKRKKFHRQRLKSMLSSEDAPTENEASKTDNGESTTQSTLPDTSSNVQKDTESTNVEPLVKSNEPQFKTGDYVTCIEGSEDGNNRLPIWRIEGKNVLQLFEAFKEEASGVLYKNTTSYSRWSPSSKHKYSKLLVNVVQCDDDTVIIEVPQSSKKSENKEVSGPPSTDNYAAHPQRENFEVYLQTLVSHALDPDFIPEIVKENDEYFLSHIKEIENITSTKKRALLSGKTWNSEFQKYAEAFPQLNISMSKEDKSCQICNCSNSQHRVNFHGQPYDSTTLANKPEPKTCDENYPLCGSCSQTVSLYSRLHHHKYYLYQLSCKKVNDVKSDTEKDSHTILEECLQDTKWMTEMFRDMMELWDACDTFR